MPLGHLLSPGNVIQTSYSKEHDAIRVTLIGSGDITTPNITRLVDGVDFLTSTVVGSERALDVNVVNGIELTISHLDDSIRLGDGTNLFSGTTVGPKTGLDVNLLGGTATFSQAPAGPTVTTYGESLALASNSSIVTATYTTPVSKVSYIQKIYISGSQVGTYTIKKNGTTFINFRTSVTKFSEIMDLSTGSAFGVKCLAGDVITVTSLNSSLQTGDFDVTIQVMEI